MYLQSILLLKKRLADILLLTFICFLFLQSGSQANLAVTVMVSPVTDTVPFGGTRQFAATVSGAANTAVTWSVNDVIGGNQSVGTIDSTGKYTAPSALPPANPVIIKAASQADPMVSASASVTVRFPIPQVQWYSPNVVPLGNTIFTVNGNRFYNGAVVTIDGTAFPTTYVSSTQLKVTSNFAQSGSGYLTVVNPGPAGATSSPRLLEWGAGITVSITPATVTLGTGAKQQFTASVSGTSDKTVYWYVNGGSVNGTITSGGLYTAPGTVPGSPVTIRAVCAVNSARSATAIVNVNGTGGGQTVSVTVSPVAATVQTGASQQFTATVGGSANQSVTWQVNNITGGNSTIGTISSTGLYVAPASVPDGFIIIRAVSQADPGKSGSTTVTVTAPANPIAVSINPASASLPVNGTQQFTATVTGSQNTAVNWQVNNVSGGNSTTGTITANGLYKAPTAIPSGAITVTAVSLADSTKKASANVAIINPNSVAIGRFLEQSTFGPTPQLTAYVNQIGIQAFLNQQLGLPESALPDFSAQQNSQLIDQFYTNLATGQDQLRQRVIYALSEIIVISRNKNVYANELAPWLQILSRNAFGNYKTLLKEITLDATMGKYLDMVNSTKPGPNGAANENYPRELMQLFSIGLYQLNQDGSYVLDANGKTIPTYGQNDIRQLALALTGWTYNTQNGPPQSLNPNYFPGQMAPLPAYHDTSSKTFLGQTIPANQTMQKDVDGAINIIFNHPNVAPFICTRLIRGLVTSNPSPAYISRISAVFNNNGQGIRGDLSAVISAILLDQEARNDVPPPDFGKLRTPLMHHIALFRVLGATIPQPSQIAYVYDNMGEGVLNAPSVFGHYSPMFRIPKQSPPLFGPEFQIHGPGELVNRGNFLWNYLSYYQTGIWDLQWLFNLGGDHNACINAVDNLLLYGRMSAGMRQQLITTLQSQAAAGADAKMRTLTVLYLTAISSEYLVMH